MSHAERMNCPDTFRPVYYAKDLGIYLIVDREAEAEDGDFVAAERIGRKVKVQRYESQAHQGVVRMLQFYLLQHSEQHTPSAMPQPGQPLSKPKFCGKARQPRRPRMPRQPRMPRWPRELAC